MPRDLSLDALVPGSTNTTWHDIIAHDPNAKQHVTKPGVMGRSLDPAMQTLLTWAREYDCPWTHINMTLLRDPAYGFQYAHTLVAHGVRQARTVCL